MRHWAYIMRKIVNINDSEKRLALQKITESAHVPAVGYACVKPKEESKDEFVNTSLTIGKKNAQSTNATVNGVDDNTRFPASSLSKVVFTYLVLQLVKEKQIRLDESLYDILPYEKFLIDNKYPEKAKQLTARHVLSHTTGLPNFGPKKAQTLSFSDNSELGKGYSYSGEAFLYLQRVLEKKMGKDLETLAKEYVFTPLGMERSTFLSQPKNDTNVVTVHTELGTPDLIYVGEPPDNAAGSLLTTADDFSKFMAAWLENMDDPIIQQAFVPTNTNDFPTCGLGWHLYRNAGEVIAYQYGCNLNTRSFVAINLKTKKAAAFFTNAEHGMSLANQILSSPGLVPIGDMRAVLKHLGYSQSDEPGWQETFEGKLAEDQGNIQKARFYFTKALFASNNDESKQRRLEWFNAVHQPTLETQAFTRPLEQFEGIFENDYNDKVELSIRDGGLIYKEFDRGIKLVRISESEFLPEKDQSFKISFDGDQMSIHYLQGPPKILKQSSPKSQNEAAVEILVFKPNSAIPPEQRGVHENLWIKQRFKQYVSIGVYLDGPDLKYYFFEDCNNTPKIYSSLVELKRELPKGLENIFDNTPKLFVMGHGRGDSYGSNHPVAIYGSAFDKIITDFEETLPKQHDEIVVTLEACNTDNCEQAARGNQEKTFLARLSETHQSMTFCGTGPWDPKDPQTGYRASGGFPTLNAPITAMGGGIWKHGNSVIFYHENYQVVVRKSMFSSTETAKELKINTIGYAREVLKETALESDAIDEMITEICANRDILRIEDLKKVPDFPQGKFEDPKEKQILEKEKNNYIVRVREILGRAESGEKFTERDLLIIALGLKDLSVFKGHEDLHDNILNNKALLQLMMVTCGKVIIADPSNDSIIDLLLERGIDINSVDEKGMSALHYAVQNFYNYRAEPLNLIKKLLDSGANLEAKDKQGRTPLMILKEHSEDRRVSAREEVQKLLEQRRPAAVLPRTHTMRSLMSTNLGFFRKLEDEYLTEHRHDDPRLQHEYDKRFGLVLK